MQITTFSSISITGLPGGSAQVLQDFVSPTSATAYQQFGDVDLAFRNAFAVSGPAAEFYTRSKLPK